MGETRDEIPRHIFRVEMKEFHGFLIYDSSHLMNAQIETDDRSQVIAGESVLVGERRSGSPPS